MVTSMPLVNSVEFFNAFNGSVEIILMFSLAFGSVVSLMVSLMPLIQVKFLLRFL